MGRMQVNADHWAVHVAFWIGLGLIGAAMIAEALIRSDRLFMRRILFRITAYLPSRTIRGENGAAYLERSFLFEAFGRVFYLHRFIAPDSSRDLHNHPWVWGRSIMLAGAYVEERSEDVGVIRMDTYRAPCYVKLSRADFHRVEALPFGDAWTLFWHPVQRLPLGWGFLNRETWRYTPYRSEGDNEIPWWKDAPSGRQRRNVYDWCPTIEPPTPAVLKRLRLRPCDISVRERIMLQDL
jgi:hypothetical protein